MLYRIDTNLDQLAALLESGRVIHLIGTDHFSEEGVVSKFFRPLLGSQETWLLNFSEKFIEHIDSLERIPIHFGLKGEAVLQGVNFQGYIHILEILEKKVKSRKLRHQFHQRIIALRYRLGHSNGGLVLTALQPDILRDLEKTARTWKKLRPLLYEKVLKDRDLRQLEHASCYPEFAELLLIDRSLRERFFDWVLRDHNSAEIFILFPALTKKIVECNLNGRLGRMGARHLCICRVPSSEGDLQQIVTLMVEGHNYSILDENAVVQLRGNYRLSIRDIFNIFKNKSVEMGNLEVLKDGVVNWNTHYYGYYDADQNKIIEIDLEDREWWKQLPLFEVLSKEQAQMRYGWHLNGINWNAAATASRGSPSLNYEESHAYLELAIPLGDDGRYAIYDFGKLAYKYPANEFEKLAMFADNLHATIAYPDENVYYTHRQHVNHSFCLTHHEGARLMHSIKKDLLEAREGNVVYQIESDNCAKWLHEKLESTVGSQQLPNLFQLPLLDAEPTGFMALAFKLLRALPKPLQVPVFMICHLPFAPFRGTWIRENGKKVYKSLMKHDFWRTGVVYLPAYLHHQKVSGAFVRSERPANVKAADPAPGWIKQFGTALVTSQASQFTPRYAYSHAIKAITADV